MCCVGGKGARGREAILDAASVLMDERGVDQVSLNEINRASGNRNRSAVTYHFGSRDAIVRELVARSMATVNADRNALLDERERLGGAVGLREGIELVVGPLSRCLATVEGRRYLRLLGQLVNHPRFVADSTQTLFVNESIMRCLPFISPSLEQLPERVRGERVSQLAGFLIRATAEQARLLDADPPPRRPLAVDDFVDNLVDVVVAMLTAPTSVDVNGTAQGRA